ncbi:MAG: hypothetical protein E6I75_18800 [Chloroflexi bacterium]|nr:MAG: hypothetical protein E6I75_18800 [Chloroflexota bacterium]
MLVAPKLGKAGARAGATGVAVASVARPLLRKLVVVDALKATASEVAGRSDARATPSGNVGAYWAK